MSPQEQKKPPEPGSREAAIQEENQKIKRLRAIVTMTSMLIRQTDMPLAEAVRLVQAVRGQALQLFPGKEQTYDLIYAPRFARILREKYGVDDPGA